MLLLLPLSSLLLLLKVYFTYLLNKLSPPILVSDLQFFGASGIRTKRPYNTRSILFKIKKKGF